LIVGTRGKGRAVPAGRARDRPPAPTICAAANGVSRASTGTVPAPDSTARSRSTDVWPAFETTIVASGSPVGSEYRPSASEVVAVSPVPAIMRTVAPEGRGW
jgi:hypothetical protein